MDVQLLMAALIYASMLVLLAQAHTLTYLTVDAPNFTVGPVAAIGVYVGFTWTKILGLQLYLGLPAAFIVCGLVGVLCYVLVVGPLMRRGRGPVLVALALIGAGVLLTGLLRVYAWRLMNSYGIWTNTVLLKGYDFSVGFVPGVFLVSTVMVLSSILLIDRLVRGTMFGVSLRAAVEDADLAAVQGVNPGRIRFTLWGLAGGLAGLAGAYGSIWFTSSPVMGETLMTGILAACLLGGFGSLRGAAVGGLLQGAGEIFLVVWG
jgi:branched-chain amino acid transport system permease protein